MQHARGRNGQLLIVFRIKLSLGCGLMNKGQENPNQKERILFFPSTEYWTYSAELYHP